jgi:hypothetical protein
LTTPEGATPKAVQAACWVAAIKIASPTEVEPKLMRAPAAVVAPVPPSAIEIGVETVDVSASTTLVPSQ